jgi:hypothetical protein
LSFAASASIQANRARSLTRTCAGSFVELAAAFDLTSADETTQVDCRGIIRYVSSCACSNF